MNNSFVSVLTGCFQFRSTEEAYEVEVVLSKTTVWIIVWAISQFALGACSSLVLRVFGLSPLGCLLVAVTLLMSLFFVKAWEP